MSADAGDSVPSLASRISKPAENNEAAKTETAENTKTEATQPTQPPQPGAMNPSPTTLPAAQTDGATEPMNGSGGIHEPEYDVNVKLNDIQADPNNPLYSIKTFEDMNLPSNLLKAIYQMRFTKPSKIQEKALPLLLKNPPENLIGQSQSGTGKTAAFVLNILTRLDLSPSMRSTPQALILAPSRELARQIMGVVQVMGEMTEGLQVVPAIPMDAASRGKLVEGSVVVGTPGTTMDLIRRRQLNARGIKVLVLDEADNMLDQQGLGDQCIRVKALLPPNLQVVLFSATFDDKIVDYANKFAPNANQITLKHEELTVEGIRQIYLDCNSEQDKYESLVKLYGLMTIGSSIIFVRTRETALNIERRMNQEGHRVVCLTGQFEGAQRDVIIDAFREGRAKVLIATNVLSRGIDVQTVSLVVNYDLPDDGHGNPDPQTYLHRIGRTGRFGRVGVSISLIHGPKSWNLLKSISDYFALPLTGLPTSDWDAIEETVQKTIKSARAGADFNKGAAPGARAVQM